MSATSSALVMEARGLVKRYGHVTALDGADFELLPGEILAVIGDNGAGKSTLIKALSGALIPDEGEMFLDGKPVRFHTPIDARRQGIENPLAEDAACLGRERQQAHQDVGARQEVTQLRLARVAANTGLVAA